MPDPDTEQQGHSARLLRALIWAGVGLAPVAAIVVLVGGSDNSVRFGVLLIAVCVVLIGASMLIRSDPVLLRMDVEDRVAAEVDKLRTELRAEIAAAARATHHRVQALQEEIGHVRSQPAPLDAGRPAVPVGNGRAAAPVGSGSSAAPMGSGSSAAPMGSGSSAAPMGTGWPGSMAPEPTRVGPAVTTGGVVTSGGRAVVPSASAGLTARARGAPQGNGPGRAAVAVPPPMAPVFRPPMGPRSGPSSGSSVPAPGTGPVRRPPGGAPRRPQPASTYDTGPGFGDGPAHDNGPGHDRGPGYYNGSAGVGGTYDDGLAGDGGGAWGDGQAGDGGGAWGDGQAYDNGLAPDHRPAYDNGPAWNEGSADDARQAYDNGQAWSEGPAYDDGPAYDEGQAYDNGQVREPAYDVANHGWGPVSRDDARAEDQAGDAPERTGKRRADVTAVDLGYTGRRSRPNHATTDRANHGPDENTGYTGYGAPSPDGYGADPADEQYDWRQTDDRW